MKLVDAARCRGTIPAANTDGGRFSICFPNMFLLSIFAIGFANSIPSISLGQAGSGKEISKNQKPDPAERWEKDIAKFEAADKKNPVKPGGVLFLGSSSIRMWDLKKFFSKKDFLNRGFGGSEISDSIYHFDRLVKPYMPATIVFYAGDNDISKKKSPKTVFEDFKTFAKKTKDILPKTKIVFVAIKPSLSRWKLVEKMREANQLIADFAKDDPNVVYADIDTPMIGDDKKPMKDLFVDDGLHMSDKGYEIWTTVITPLLD